ncbi:MAG TPA: undecaprenyldiphospho-muramoylpentapeptide beta-N-acetylglucosaminyltransferase [Casimicrobiaceae bacterium]|nr:undecaprenyldiphospho-muramoylpentapeptide beta-N-acetylglucosaminyltransferase [Casimicrobiaceae bacterium]
MSGTVMITTGGTGGHIFPGLAVAAELIARDWRVFWLGTRDGMESHIVPRHRIDFEGLIFASVRGKGLLRLLLAPYAILYACWQAHKVIQRRRPNVVVGFGGFASFPGALMAVAQDVPLIIHNLDAKPGLANRVLRFGADRVLTGFPATFGAGRDKKVAWVGTPLRADIAAVAPPEERFRGRSGPLKLLVVGGSLGAAALNECVPRALSLLEAAARPQVTHQAGEKHIDALCAAYSKAGVSAECLAFIDDMGERYAVADLVICRAGATTVAELAAVGIGSVLVPFPYAAGDHQVDNAQVLAGRGAAEMILQQDLTPERLAAWLANTTREALQKMAIAARTLRKADAAQRVADTCIAVAQIR